jgi:cyclophilin family peptidyl-prolyl cis-trans isomerase
VLRSLVVQQGTDVAALLIDHLGYEDVVVRKTAAVLLGQLGRSDSAVIAALEVALAAAEDDAPYLVRGAVLDAMVEIRGVDASELLMDALDDADWAVRVRAAEHLDALTPAGGHQDVIRPAPGRNSVRFDDPRLVSPTVSPHVYIETVRGTIELELNVIDAPIAADNFMTLARRGFYDGLTLHRVVPNYVVQGGDPRSDSEGGPGYTLRDELNQVPFMRGTVGMALDWQDTGGSQFFITHSPQPRLDGRYTPFAQVVSGMDVVDRIQRGDLIDRMLVWDGVQPF